MRQGQEYRVYACLDVDGNNSAFCKANYRVIYYKVNDYRYHWDIDYLYSLYLDYDLSLMSYQDIYYRYDIVTHNPLFGDIQFGIVGEIRRILV